MHVARRLGGAALLATLLAAPAWSQEAQPVFGRRNVTPYAYPPSYCPPGYPGQPGYPVQPGQPGMLPGTIPGAPQTAQPPTAQPTQPGAQPQAEQPNAAATQPSTDFGQASAAGSSAASSGAPTMIGDLGAGVFARQLSHSSRSTSTAILPLPGRGAFKIDENESPRPQDRFFLTYNYFNSVGFNGTPTYDLHREVAGFEKTFLDGNASIGMRFNIFQTDPSGGLAFDGNDFGDISIVTKYAFINDRQTGDVLAGGLVISVPTGPDVLLPDGHKLNPTLLQPYMGWILNFDRLYLLGFSSVVIPTDDRDAVLITNSVAAGWRLYEAAPNEGGWLTSITPTVEAHLTDPLSKRGINPTLSPIGYPDILAITSGVHWGLGERSTITSAIVTPVVGPKPYDFEAVVQFNFRF